MILNIINIIIIIYISNIIVFLFILLLINILKGKAGKYNPNGYAALAKEYNVDEKVIYNVVKHKGRYA